MIRTLFRLSSVLADLTHSALARLFSERALRATLYVFAGLALGALFNEQAFTSQDADRWHRLGERQIARLDLTAGLTSLQRAVDLRPNKLKYRHSLAAAQIYMGRDAEALQTLEAAWGLTPSRRTLHLMGVANEQLELHDVAIGYFSESMSVGHEGKRWQRENALRARNRALIAIARNRVHMKQPQAAISILNRAIREQSSSVAPHISQYPETHFWLGVAYWLAGDQNAGLFRFRNAVALDPGDANSWYNIACYYAVRNQTNLALASLQTAVDNGFSEPEYFVHDGDLANLHGLPRFDSLHKRVKKVSASHPPVGPRSEKSVASLIEHLQNQEPLVASN